MITFTEKETILIAIIWIGYGFFNSYQHKFFSEIEQADDFAITFFTVLNIAFAPVILCIRIIKGVFIWNGKL